VKSNIFLITSEIIIMALMPYLNGSLAQNIPEYLYDRGTGTPTSQFGTYVRKGELLIYPFYEYYNDKDFEYEPLDFGYSSTKELRGNYRAHEGLIFFRIWYF